jgi:hypothetical protein
MTDKYSELVKDVAAKHGVALSKNDPLLMLVTINDRLLNDALQAQQELLQLHKEEMEEVALRWGNAATTKAELIINISLTASQAALTELMQEEQKKLVAAFRTEIDSALTNINANIKDTRPVAIFNIISACITLCAAGIALWATLG